jgi:hypothetical protein
MEVNTDTSVTHGPYQLPPFQEKYSVGKILNGFILQLQLLLSWHFDFVL